MQLNADCGRDVNFTLPFGFCVKRNNFMQAAVSSQDMQLCYKGQESPIQTPCCRLGGAVTVPAEKAL